MPASKANSRRQATPVQADQDALSYEKWLEDAIRASLEAKAYAETNYEAFDPENAQLKTVCAQAKGYEKALKLADYRAEAACIRGNAERLAKYFKQVGRSPYVIQNIAWDLLADLASPGPRNQVLRFQRRKGGRPKNDASSGFEEWLDTQAPALRRRSDDELNSAFANGDRIALARLLLQQAKVLDDSTARSLGEALDPKGASKWQLRFHRRRGNQRTKLETAIRDAIIKMVLSEAEKEVRRHAQIVGEKARFDSIDLDPEARAPTIYARARRQLRQKFGIEVSASTLRAARRSIKNPPY